MNTELEGIRNRQPVVIDISEKHTLNAQLLAMTGDGWNKHDWHGTLESGLRHIKTGLRVIVKPRSYEKELLNALQYLYREANLNGLLDVEPSMKQARAIMEEARGEKLA